MENKNGKSGWWYLLGLSLAGGVLVVSSVLGVWHDVIYPKSSGTVFRFDVLDWIQFLWGPFTRFLAGGAILILCWGYLQRRISMPSGNLVIIGQMLVAVGLLSFVIWVVRLVYLFGIGPDATIFHALKAISSWGNFLFSGIIFIELARILQEAPIKQKVGA